MKIVDVIKMNRGGGTSLTGNLVDDWVTAVTQGEYTKYEDVPEADSAGALTGWRRESSNYRFIPTKEYTVGCDLRMKTSYFRIIKDGNFKEYFEEG